MNKDFIIVDFEGLDCSFKETNSNALTDFINSGSKDVIAKRYAFPNYSAPSSYFVRQYLKGVYEDADVPHDTIIKMYMFDQFDQWNTKILPDIKNGIRVVVLDRFWLSNLYYFGVIDEGENRLNEIISDRIVRTAYWQFKLPKPDVVFKMNTDIRLMLNNVHAKNAKNDIHEANDQFLTDTFNRFDVCNFDKAAGQVININVFSQSIEYMENDKIRIAEAIDSTTGIPDQIRITQPSEREQYTIKVITKFKSKAEIKKEVIDKFTWFCETNKYKLPALTNLRGVTRKGE